jgi:hypothetical protein
MRRLLGIGAFLAAAALALVYAFADRSSGDPLARLLRAGRPPLATVMGYVGGEKLGFLDDAEVKDILRDRYGLVLDARRAGSIEMVTDSAIIDQRPSFLWPSTQIALDLARESGLAVVADSIVFNSPIVLFSWSSVAEALEARGLARALSPERAAWAVDMRALLDLVDEERGWSDLGLANLNGTVMLYAADPVRSSSGNHFAALAFSLLDDPGQGTAGTRTAMAKVARLQARMGYAEHSSQDLFEQYLRMGVGAKPIIAGYESQLIEFAAAQPDAWRQLEGRKQRPVVLYPEPTVYSSHVLLALDANGRRLLEALRDPDLQALAWQRHGFRSGTSTSNAVAGQAIAGLPEVVEKIVPLPPREVMRQLLDRLSGKIPGS